MKSLTWLQAAGAVPAAEEHLPQIDRDQACELVDAQAVSAVLQQLTLLTPRALVRTGDGRAVGTRVLGVVDDAIGLVLEPDAPVDAGPALLQCELHDVLFYLRGRLRCADGRVELLGPLRLYKSDRREVFRTALADGRAELHWTAFETEQPRCGHSYVRDLTPSGAAVVPAPGSNPPPPGVFPAELRVGERRVPCLAETRRVPSEAAGTYGLHLSAGETGQALIDVYLSERLPRLVPRTEVDTKALRAVMLKSGYLSLRAGQVSVASWQRCQPLDSFACDRVYRAADGQLLGHASATRIYRRTWILHQLATLGGHAESGQCRAMLYSMLTSVPVIYDGLRASAMAYFDLDLRWHQLFFQDFIRWIDAPDLACIFAFDRFEREAPPEPFAPPAGYEIRLASEADLVGCSALIRAQLPSITAEALDTHPADLRRPPVRRGYRGREVLVLLRDGQLVGVALCETGAPSLSLFNIVNMAQLYVARGGRAPSAPAQRALISAARAFYTLRKIANPLLIAPAGTLQHDAEPGTRWAESMGSFVVTGRGLTQWEDYCRFQFGMRWGMSKQSSEKEDKP